jgi:subtilisin family serine protease
MPNSIRPTQPTSITGKPSKRLADTPENQTLLKQEAAKDGKASVVAKQGNDLLLLSGAYRTESKIARVSADDAISKGDALKVNGAKAKVLQTDDGFKEVDLSKVTVAVIDTGVQVVHSAFKDNTVLPGYNAKTKDGNVKDRWDHGTHVAGIIAGSAPAMGIEGVAQGATLMPIKLSTPISVNSNLMDRLADSIRYAVDNGANVINVSLGVDMESWTMKQVHGDSRQKVDEALRYAEEKGVVVVAAAGNSGNEPDTQDTVSYPANVSTVITVSNLDDTRPKDGLDLHPTSSVGPAVDLAAPGTDITSSVPDNKADKMTGTSMAAPYVAGVVAQIIARHPDWTPAQVRKHLATTATDLGKPGLDIRFGNGAVDPFKAIHGE